VIAPIVEANLGLAVGLFEPLTVVADVAYVHLSHGNHEGGPAQPSWCLEVESLVAPERDWEPRDTRVTVAAIDRAALEQFLRTASSQQPPEGLSTCPVVLWVRSTRALLPQPWSLHGREIPVRFHGGRLSLVAEADERGIWVVGPGASLLRPPIRTYGAVEGIRAEMQIEAHWSPWYEEGAAGTLAIERAVAALEAQGWRRTR
jgi:hypothetical protein